MPLQQGGQASRLCALAAGALSARSLSHRGQQAINQHEAVLTPAWETSSINQGSAQRTAQETFQTLCRQQRTTRRGRPPYGP